MKHLIVIAWALLAAPATQCLAERLADDLKSDQELCGAFADCIIIDSYDDLLLGDIGITLLGLEQIRLIQDTYQEPFPYASALFLAPIASFQNSLYLRDGWIQTPAEPDIALSVVSVIEELMALSSALESVKHLPPTDWSAHAPLEERMGIVRVEIFSLTAQLDSVTFLPVPEPQGVVSVVSLALTCYWWQRV